MKRYDERGPRRVSDIFGAMAESYSPREKFNVYAGMALGGVAAFYASPFLAPLGAIVGGIIGMSGARQLRQEEIRRERARKDLETV